MKFRWPQDKPAPVKMGSRELDDGAIERYVEFAGDKEDLILTEVQFARAQEEGLKAISEFLDVA